jgi:uncharacterized membrane protein YccC
MYAKYLEIIELRECALAAREKAARATRLAERTLKNAALFRQHVGAFEARAMEFDRRREELEAGFCKPHGPHGQSPLALLPDFAYGR